VSVASVDKHLPGPIVAVALHAAHRVRGQVARRLAIAEVERLREEDPFTELWTCVGDVRVIAGRSRFEVDLNRSREDCVYLAAEQSWGRNIWRRPPTDGSTERSRELHERFYGGLRRILDDVATRYGRFVVLDLHSYNHRRGGPDARPADPARNPEVNLGTDDMDRDFWDPVVDRFLDRLSSADFCGRHLDVRENVRFRGAHLPHWVHESYPGVGCALAVEWKKFFMDEWSGRGNPDVIVEIGRALAKTVPALREGLERV